MMLLDSLSDILNLQHVVSIFILIIYLFFTILDLNT